jgi:subtilisin-like proprotein convertase family protein
MSWAKITQSTRTFIYSAAVFTIAAIALWFGANTNNVNASSDNGAATAPQATFPGTGVGAIPDSPGGTPPVYGTPLVINFTVAGVSGPVTNVSLDMTLTHSWAGDLDVVLAAPGGTPSFTIFSRIGAVTATSFGSSSDFSGTYTFTDTAAGANIWTAAAATPIPAGSYRTTAPGGAGQTNPAPVTSLNTAFGGLTPAQANGTWTLTFRDGGGGDTGSVTAANLTINPTGVVVTQQHVVDFDGDGKTDYSVVRNTGGGPSGQVTWFNSLSSGGTQGVAWGIATDFFVPEDYDGDNKTDFAIWRPGAATAAAFYILQSQTNTVRIETFGQTGDDPTVVGDYNGDGKTDVAVYRAGASTGAQSTWFYRTTAGGPVTFTNWGSNGDFPAPGDYDGDGKNDFVVQRNNGGGQARFYELLATGTINNSNVFGTPTDVLVPGDYDGDGKTDIATIRGSGGVILWFYRRSSDSVDVSYQAFGNSATDFPVQGDYDGDGKTDLAVWRPNADPTQNFFYFKGSTSGSASQAEWGANGDYPVANYNAH